MNDDQTDAQLAAGSIGSPLSITVAP